MSYTRNPDWQDGPGGKTPITSDRLDHIEDGLVATSVQADLGALGVPIVAWDGASAVVRPATAKVAWLSKTDPRTSGVAQDVDIWLRPTDS